MAQINVVGNNARTIELELPKANPNLLHEVVTWQLAKRRAGTASTKTRTQVSATSKKMYSQKGTGNARHGDRGAPNFVGGGVAFGPKPRSYAYSLPKKVRQLGLAMALSDRSEQGKLLAVDGFGLSDHKTKGFVSLGQGQRHGRLRARVPGDRRRRGAPRRAQPALGHRPAGRGPQRLRHPAPRALVIDAAVLEPAKTDVQEGEQQ